MLESSWDIKPAAFVAIELVLHESLLSPLRPPVNMGRLVAPLMTIVVSKQKSVLESHIYTV